MAQLCDFQCRVRQKTCVVDTNSVCAVLISGTYAARPPRTHESVLYKLVPPNPIQFLNELIVVRYVVRSVTVAQQSVLRE